MNRCTLGWSLRTTKIRKIWILRLDVFAFPLMFWFMALESRHSNWSSYCSKVTAFAESENHFVDALVKRVEILSWAHILLSMIQASPQDLRRQIPQGHGWGNWGPAVILLAQGCTAAKGRAQICALTDLCCFLPLPTPLLIFQQDLSMKLI